ncbi:hypothetical protein BaRGS_00025160 [Batillaria attramentaria]|uniref:Uncharacterized protein n=1 Tax=Batillaria attramentaria TaxID=370345 RepID=A0ABD0K944_9CAEN
MESSSTTRGSKRLVTTTLSQRVTRHTRYEENTRTNTLTMIAEFQSEQSRSAQRVVFRVDPGVQLAHNRL